MSEQALMAVAQQVYVGGLFLICTAVLFHKVADIRAALKLLFTLSPTRRVAVTLFFNWTLNMVFVLSTGIKDPWFWFIGVDASSAAVILRQPAGKAQAAIGCTYMAQIIMHCVYGVSNHAMAEPRYWQILTALAFVQLLLLGGWSIGRGSRNIYHRWNSRRLELAGAKSGSGVA